MHRRGSFHPRGVVYRTLTPTTWRSLYGYVLGGWRSDELEWPEVQDAMIDGMVRLERALKPQIAGLKSEFA